MAIAGYFELPPLPEQEDADAEWYNFYRPAQVLAYGQLCARAAVAADRDAMRYRWLREQQWNTSKLFVVAGGKQNVKLGVDCPTLFRMDEMVDAAIAGEIKP